MNLELYDPLTYENLMMGLVVSYEKQGTLPLSEDSIRNIDGPGIYSLYYSGELTIYKSIKDSRSRPIYVGRAVPPGSRKGDSINIYYPSLRSRIREHLKSINQVRDLTASHFTFRSLAVEPVWITLAERFLIDHYLPVWNRCIDGFGIHDPGKGRQEGEKSWWDTLHPGRPFAANLRVVKTQEAAIVMVKQFFKNSQTK
ncbi:MAG: Eco29kI family restriction endonuclease [Gemmatimonadetes bacterium]|nr:Eco29kI family restriction endonuclease [Gemmatimonadota bacterium]